MLRNPVYGRGLKTERSTGVRRGQTAQRTAERGATARDPANTARRRDRATETADPKEAGRLADTTPGARRRSGDQEDPGAPGRRPRRGDVVLCVRWRSQSATPGWATAARVRASATPCADGTTPDRAADDRPRGSLHRPYRPRVGTPFLGTGPAARRGTTARATSPRICDASSPSSVTATAYPETIERVRPGTGSRYARPPAPATSPFRPLSRATPAPHLVLELALRAQHPRRGGRTESASGTSTHSSLPRNRTGKDSDGNYLATCQAPETVENGLRPGAVDNFISITVLS